MNALCIAVAVRVSALTLTGSALALPTANAADAPAAPPALAGNSTSAPQEGSIPFARRNIFDWVADGDKGIWVQAIGRQWYYGTFLSPCLELQFRNGVGFRFGPSGELDKWGAVVVPHYPECRFTSFTVSNGPPRAKKKAPSAQATTPSPSPGAAVP